MALANTLAALQAGVERLDGVLGGPAAKAGRSHDLHPTPDYVAATPPEQGGLTQRGALYCKGSFRGNCFSIRRNAA